MLPVQMRTPGYHRAVKAPRLRALWVLVAATALVATACELPDLAEERADAPELAQTSFLYAADGTMITPLHAEVDRVVVPSSKIPDVLRNAVIAIEDKRFYEHRGIDLKALLRAAYVDATSGRIVEGGSTITQQYVKQAYVGDEETLVRKLREAYLAWQLEHELSKDEILTSYLNTVYFGNGAYGIQSAAETYFSRPAKTLTLAQSALLAGLIRAPNDYDPVAHPNIAGRRRNHVLGTMLDLGMIDDQQYLQASSKQVRLRLHRDTEQRYPAPYFVDYFKQWFLSNRRFGETVQERYDLLFYGGLRITTTLDPHMQREAETAISSILLYPNDPYAALTAIDPRTGYIRAMVGGRDFWAEDDRYARVNLATGGSTGRQAGSAFKVFALVAALEHGISPRALFSGSSVAVPLREGTVWTPENAEGAGYGTISMETATVNSVNVAYVNIEKAIGGGNIYAGAERVVQTARRMGIRCCTRTTSPDDPLAPVPSAVLGTNEVNALEMASAYGTLAFGGQRVQPTPVIEIRTASGDLLYRARPNPRQVVEPSIATTANEILQKVVLYGTGQNANIGRPQIGKTGTAQNYSDAWFVGAIPQLSVAVWAGFPQGQIPMCCGRTRINPVYGGTWPAQIWRAFMVKATTGMPEREFPTSVVRYVTLRVDVTRGCLANQFTPPQDIQVQTYLVGTQPKLRVCKEPSSYPLLTIPSVVGLKEGPAGTALRNAGFNVRVVYEVLADQTPGVVIGQDPAGGERAPMTSVVRITVATRGERDSVTVPNVIGRRRRTAEARLERAGLSVSVVEDAECDPAEPSCDYRPGIVWAQSPTAGVRADAGATVTIVVNP
jgi:penicillin-binding protein 1A